MKIRSRIITGALGLFLLGTGSISAQDVVSDKTAEKAERKAMIEAYRADIKAIKEDTALTDEQKEAKIKEIRQEMPKKRGKRKYIPGQGKDGERSAAQKAEREAIKKHIQAIDENTSLSPEEKAAAKRQIREEQRAKYNKRKGAKVGSDGNGKGGRKAHKRKSMKRLNEKVDSGLSDEEKTKVLKRLEDIDGKLDKQYSKGKISEESYTKRKAEIKELRSKI